MPRRTHAQGTRTPTTRPERQNWSPDRINRPRPTVDPRVIRLLALLEADR